MTLETATREGARVGSALTNGGGDLGCNAGQSPDAALVDPQIVAAIQRVLTSPGSRVIPAKITEVKIYKVKSSDASGNQNGSGNTNANIWEYHADPGNPVVDGAALNFRTKPGTSTGWQACSRSNGNPTDSIGISLIYTYEMVTPLPAVMRFFGGGADHDHGQRSNRHGHEPELSTMPTTAALAVTPAVAIATRGRSQSPPLARPDRRHLRRRDRRVHGVSAVVIDVSWYLSSTGPDAARSGCQRARWRRPACPGTFPGRCHSRGPRRRATGTRPASTGWS